MIGVTPRCAGETLRTLHLGLSQSFYSHCSFKVNNEALRIPDDMTDEYFEDYPELGMSLSLY